MWVSNLKGGAGTMSDPMDEDPRPPDQRTPPPTPSPQVVGEPEEATQEAEVAMVDVAYHAAFEVSEEWSMPRHNTYEHSLCNFMAFAHNRDFVRYKKGTIFSRAQLLEIKPQHVHNWLERRLSTR